MTVFNQKNQKSGLNPYSATVWIQSVLFIFFFGFLKYLDLDFFSKILNCTYIIIIVQGEGPVEVCEGPGPGPQPARQGQALRTPPPAGQGQEMKPKIKLSAPHLQRVKAKK
jgi:hypothetical protein